MRCRGQSWCIVMMLNELYKQADYKDKAGMMFNFDKNYFDVAIKKLGG